MNVESEIVKDGSGEPVLMAKLTPEQYETLKVLFDSQGWKLYRQILIASKEWKFHSTLAMTNPNEVMKNIGMVAGINFAVNQLGVLMGYYNKKAKSVSGETTNLAGP